MAYFRKLPKLPLLIDLLARGGSWLIFVNADPDAMASAMALKRIMSHKAATVGITRINEVTRPDNLAMIRYARLHMLPYSPDLVGRYQHYALVDSQPQHNPLFADVPFSIIIDHHPLPPSPPEAAYCEIRPEYGAASTLMTEHLYNLGIRPAKLLATGLLFGIKSDTANFERKTSDVDIRAYHYLARFADQALLSRIARSEFHMRWMPYFARAWISMRPAGSGQFVYVDAVENPDILVVIADFLMRVYEIRWVAVSGRYNDTVVVIYRGDGVTRDLGRLAGAQFGDIGSAGGHKAMARAEFPLEAVKGQEVDAFVYKRVVAPPRRKAAPREASVEDGGQPQAAGNAAPPEQSCREAKPPLEARQPA